ESVSTAAPTRVVRNMAAGESSPGLVLSTRRETAIAFDPAEHRFVNSASASSNERIAIEGRTAPPANGERQINAGNPGTRGSDLRRAGEGASRGSAQMGSRSTSAPPSRASIPPPPSSGARVGGYSGTSGGGRVSSSGGASAGSSGSSSRSWSGGSSSSSSSSGSSHPASSSSSSSGG